MKKVILSMLILATAGTGLGVTALASTNSETNKAIGGWSEDKGYFQIENINGKSSEPKHIGKTITGINSTGDPYKACQASTKWTGVYHWTRARVQNPFTGTIYKEAKDTDHGATYAETSKYYYGINPTVAKSNYGRA